MPYTHLKSTLVGREVEGHNTTCIVWQSPGGPGCAQLMGHSWLALLQKRTQLHGGRWFPSWAHCAGHPMDFRPRGVIVNPAGSGICCKSVNS